jgi:energy-coupling factor transporter ATP-binding protein EcfA2
LYAVQQWALDDEQDAITRSDVERLLSPESEVPPNAFDLPTNRVDRPELKAELARRINSFDSGYIVVLGPPGSGKSTLLNTLDDGSPPSADRKVIVYNCLTGAADRFLRTRALAGNFVRFLAGEFARLVPGFRRAFDPGPDTLEVLLYRLSRCETRRKMIFVFDGVDYAARFASEPSRNLFDSLPVNLPRRVVCVVSAQVREQLPQHLWAEATSDALHIPPLDLPQVRQLLNQRGIPQSRKTPQHETDELARQVLDLTNGHALLVNYAVQQIDDAIQSGRPIDAIWSQFPGTAGDVDAYYKLIFRPPASTLAREAISVMAASPFELRASEIASILGTAVDPRLVEDSLRPFSHLFNRTGATYRFGHDSLRVFALGELSPGVFPASKQIEFLQQRPDDPRTGEHLLHLIAEKDLAREALSGIDCDWLARQIATDPNTALLQEGPEQLAVATMHQDYWQDVARWWALKACLEKAEWDGGLHESMLVDAWLAVGQTETVERYLFVTSQYLSTVYPGPDLIDLLQTHGFDDLAARLSDRVLSQSSPRLQNFGPDPEFERYIRHLGVRAEPATIIALVRRSAEEACALEPDHRSRTIEEEVERYSQIAAYECLSEGQLDRLGDWLRLRPPPFPEEVAADLACRHFLALRAADPGIEAFPFDLTLIDDINLLCELQSSGGFDATIRELVAGFDLPPLVSDGASWLQLDANTKIHHLLGDLTLSHRLRLTNRYEAIEAAVARQSNPAARAFNSGICLMARILTARPAAWSEGAQAILNALQPLVRHSHFSSDVIRAAQFYVCPAGVILQPVAKAAQMADDSRAFGCWLESQLLPTLTAARICYECGLVSMADMLHREGICAQVVLKLLVETESSFKESICFNSESLLGLTARFARAGDQVAAQRTLFAGIRAAFTYGFRKDTTINHFILAFEAVGEHLSARFRRTANFITSLLLVLDQLTDGRMIYGAPAHFVAVVAKFDVELAARIASRLHNGCRQLRSSIAPALKDHGLDPRSIRAKFKTLAPQVDFGKVKKGEDPRAYFVVDDTPLPSTPRELCSTVQELIETDGYGLGLHHLTAVIRSLLTRNRVHEAIAVFDEFENAMRALVSAYPLPAS